MALTFYMSPISLLVQLFSNIGIPLQGGSVAVYLAGTTTPTTTWTDSTGATANANPIVLSAAGRLQSAGGAPVACWVPAGTVHKMVISDSGANQILTLDNLTGINDPSQTNTGLANPASGFGADLVANAVRSYDIFASVRAANVPVLAGGQTLIIVAQGATAVGDGLGGEFYWSASSTAADDGATVLKPTAAATGRYLRIFYSPYLINASGSFTATTTDMSGGTSSATIFWTKVGNLVTLCCDTVLTGTSSTVNFTLTGLPANLQPARAQNQTGALAGAKDNNIVGSFTISITGAVISFFYVAPGTGVVGNWTASGLKMSPAFNYSYLVN